MLDSDFQDVTKVTLRGHVHNHPERMIEHYYHWPRGFSLEALQAKVQGFQRAFSNTTVRYE